jgi:hypothetical protein
MRNKNSKHSLAIGLFIATLGLFALPLVAFAQPQELIPEKTSLDDHPPRTVSAFFGLDNALSLRAARLWPSALGKDGIPMTFSRRVEEPIEPAAFTVITRSGVRLQPSTERCERGQS